MFAAFNVTLVHFRWERLRSWEGWLLWVWSMAAMLQCGWNEIYSGSQRQNHVVRSEFTDHPLCLHFADNNTSCSDFRETQGPWHQKVSIKGWPTSGSREGALYSCHYSGKLVRTDSYIEKGKWFGSVCFMKLFTAPLSLSTHAADSAGNIIINNVVVPHTAG